MKDIDRFIELYKSVGIDLKPIQKSNGDLCLELTMGDDPKLTGYCGFYSEITFNSDGVFQEQGFYE